MEKRDYVTVFKLIDEKYDDPSAITNIEIIHFKPKDKKISLKEMQELVGGYIEMGQTMTIDNQPHTIFVDEEGIPKGRPINHGFYWSYGTEYRGTVICVPEELLE